MSLQLIPNQNVSFWETEDFNTRNKNCNWDTRVWCQPVQYDTVTKFMVKNTKATGFQLISNGDFNSDLSSWTTAGESGAWTWNNGTALMSSNNSATAKQISQSFTSVANTIYKVCWKITAWTPGLRLAFASVSAEDSGGNTIAGNGGDPLIDANAEEQCAYFQAVDATTTILFSTEMIGSFRLDDVVVTNVTTSELLTITIQDSNDVTVKTIGDIVSIGNYSMVTIDWTGLQEGVYRICITGIGDTSFDYLAAGAALIQENGGFITLKPGKGRPLVNVNPPNPVGWLRWG